jgi:hypothetical protein
MKNDKMLRKKWSLVLHLCGVQEHWKLVSQFTPCFISKKITKNGYGDLDIMSIETYE